MKRQLITDCRVVGINCGSSIIKSMAIIIMLAAMSVSLMSCEKQVKLDFKTNYQAVLTSNNSAYFGHIEEMGSQFITLTDIFYIQSRPTDDPKLLNNLLIQRGNELHKPDRMYINREHVVVIEPVANDSKLAELIKQEKEKAKQK